MSLYRKHRPQKFIDLVGQDHIRQTLENALTGDLISHAYLFSGPKGSGKTTTARLLAKALNCSGRGLDKANFEPCDKCQSCQEVTSGTSMDVIEIDAASNRGIDEIRELRDKVRFAPTAGKYKIYIIDECHMLTKEAFNALLKTLEEPPAHAVFIFATTELHKVPPTILSRTQFFDFRKGKPEEIFALLEKVAKAEKLKIEPDALKLIARLSFGAYRDAVNMLDQVATLKTTDQLEIKLDQVQMMLGQATENRVWEFVEAISEKNRQSAFKIVEQIYFEGKDLSNFIAGVVEILRKIILIKAKIKMDFEASSEEIAKLEEIAAKFTIDELAKVIEKMVAAASQVKTSVMAQLPLEMAIFELTEESTDYRPQTADYNKKEKTINIEKKVEIKQKTDIPKSEPVIQNIQPKSKTVDSKPSTVSLEKFWPEIIKAIRKHNYAIAAMLDGAVIESVTDTQINLKVKFKFHAEQICNKKNLAIIEAEINKISGNGYKIECVADKDLEIKKPQDDEEKVLDSALEVFGEE